MNIFVALNCIKLHCLKNAGCNKYVEDSHSFSWQDMLGHTNSFDEHVTLQTMKTCITKTFTCARLLSPPAPSLFPSVFTPLHLHLLFFLFPPQPAEYLEEQKSSAVHLAAVPGSNTPSYSSASQAPVDNPFSPPFSASSSTPPTPPLALIPIPGPRGRIRCQCPRKTLLSGTCGESSAVLSRAFTDSHSSVHVSIASQVLAKGKSNFQERNQLMYSQLL